MDTPRTNVGDATYLGRPPPDFDMTQEPSFQSPTKDNNLLQQMRNGRAVSLRTPRGSRAPLGDKRNLPAGIGGSEFTPMLKSATRNSARRRGKENTNGLTTTPGLGKIDEDMDMTNVPVESSLFGPSRHMSYVDATPLPEVDASSTTSTPMALPTRRGGNKGPLQDGNQLSLREQENVIDKIEKENFGLKLKIHFLEEALRKNGPGYSEAALKENTELKVDKVTMQRELSKYKKHLASAEKDLETYQQQILDVQEKAKKKYADQGQRAENDALRRSLEEREAEIESLQRQLQRQSEDDGKADKLRDEIGDLEADLRAKDREINEREDEIDELKTRLEEFEEQRKAAEQKITNLERQGSRQDDAKADQLHNKISDLEADLREKDSDLGQREAEIEDLQRRLQQQSEHNGKTDQLQSKISNLEADLREKDIDLGERKAEIESLRRRLQQQSKDDGKTHQLHSKISDLEAGLRAKDREVNEREDEIDELKTRLEEIEERRKVAEQKIANLERQGSRQDANARQIEELQEKVRELEADLQEKEIDLGERDEELAELDDKLKKAEDGRKSAEQRTSELLQQREEWGNDRRALLSKLEVAQNDLGNRTDEKNLLQLRHDALGGESASLQQDIARLRRQVADLEDSLEQEKTHALQMDREMNQAHQSEVDRLNDDIADLEDEIERVRQEALGDKSSASAEIRQIENRYKNDSEKWQTERRDLEAQRDRLEDRAAGLQRTIDRLRDVEGSLSGKEMRLQDALNSESERHKSEEAALSRQINELRHDLEARQSALTGLRDDISTLREELRQSKLDCQEQAEKIEALEDEVEVLEATREEESEDANQKLGEAVELCRDFKRQLELAWREQGQRADRLGQLEDADRVAENLKQQLVETKQNLRDAEKERDELKRKVDGSSRQESRELAQANQATEDLRRQLLRAQEESKKAKALCDDLRSQLDAAREDLDHVNPLCKELRQKLDRARNERAAHQASAEKLRVDCERLKKGAQEALAWIQAKNAEKPTSSVAPGPIKKAAMATFRYGDVVMDVVDQKDHEAVIRAADSAQRRHEKEIRGMVLQMEWMQARWERESKLRNDSAFAKKFLQLRLDIADACNKADLRILNRIHQDLGLKSPAELLTKRQKDRKPVNKLKVFVGVIRAVARMRLEAKKWNEHEKTRKRLVAAWEDQKQQQVLC